MCIIVEAVEAAWAENPHATDTELCAIAVQTAREAGDSITSFVRGYHGIRIQRAKAGEAWLHQPKKAGP